jgi:hypothetical protein
VDVDDRPWDPDDERRDDKPVVAGESVFAEDELVANPNGDDDASYYSEGRRNIIVLAGAIADGFFAGGGSDVPGNWGVVSDTNRQLSLFKDDERLPYRGLA